MLKHKDPVVSNRSSFQRPHKVTQGKIQFEAEVPPRTNLKMSQGLEGLLSLMEGGIASHTI